MARQTVAGRTDNRMSMVYKYGIPHWAEISAEAEEQFRLAGDLSRKLSNIWKEYQEHRSGIYSQYPEVNAAEQSAEASRSLVELREQELRDARKIRRSTVPEQDVLENYLAAKAASKAASAALKLARKSAEGSHPYLKGELQEATARWKSSIIDARKEAAANGLYWGTYNAVIDAHHSAVDKILERRSQGLPAEDPAARQRQTLVCQLQRQADKPVRSPDLIASGAGPWRNQFTLTPWRDGPDPSRKERYGKVMMRVSTQSAMELPVIVHRYLPADADITRVALKREKASGHYHPSGPKWKYTLHVSFYTAAPHLRGVRSGLSTTAVDLGWESTPNGLLVARVGAGNPILPDPPASLMGAIQEVDSGWYFYLPGNIDHEHHPLPSSLRGEEKRMWCLRNMRGRMSHPAGIRSTRDDNLEKIRIGAADVIKNGMEVSFRRYRSGSLTEDPVTAAEIMAWRSPAKFARLALAWSTNDPLYPALEEWRKRDAHLGEYEFHERMQLNNARDDLYLKFAAWITDACWEINIKEIKVATIKRRKKVSEEDIYLDRGSRANAQHAAVGKLLIALKSAARRRGVSINTYVVKKESDERIQDA